MRRICIDWGVSSFFGWGIYGLNMVLEFGKMGGDVEFTTMAPVNPQDIVLSALESIILRKFIERYSKQTAIEGASWLHAIGNEFLPENDASKIGVVFFEEPLSPSAIERAKRYDIIVTGSRWNEEVLKGYGLTNVRMIHQGVDRAIFHPAPRQNIFGDRFVIFSGGKAEPRKGQDLVVKAFRIFAKRHPEAVLVTAWHSPWPELARGMDLDLKNCGGLVVDVDKRANSRMAGIYRECDVALFPNRAEGGTNLVAMECLACGVPTILSDNTGHKDLAGRGPTLMLGRQDKHAIEGWGESNLDEILALLEHRFTQRRSKAASKAKLDQLVGFYWNDAAQALLRWVTEVYPAVASAA